MTESFDLDTFIKSHGLIKSEMILGRSDVIVLCENCIALLADEQIELVSWDDEHTILYRYGTAHSIELWTAGKQRQRKKYQSVEQPHLLSACLDFYAKQDELVGTEYDVFGRL